jgi:hypothetical protein
VAELALLSHASGAWRRGGLAGIVAILAMRRTYRHSLPFLATIVLLACGSCARSASQSAPPLLRIIATDAGFVMPSRVPAGITEVHLVNRGHTTHEGVFTHFLTEDATAAAYVDSVRAGVDVPAFAEDVGGPGLALPGDSTVIWTDLTPGRYAVACWYANDLTHGGMREFEVIASRSHARPPVADMVVHMLDYTYDFPGTWPAGSHLVRVENLGTEAHEFDPYRLEKGKTPADFTRWKESGRKGPAPAKPLGGSGTFVPGRRIWLPLTLTPGRYFAFCEMPAKVGGRPHYKMGMLREFVVR